VIPAYNEEDNVEIAYKRLKEVLDSTNYDYELIFVDDGSKDNTLSKLLELYEKDKK
jgi:Glycosyl transferase family 2.